MPVRSVLDYRDADEVQAKPDILWSGADYHHVPANPLSSEVNANLEKLTNETLAAFDARAFMLELYRRLPFGNAAYQRLAQLLSNPGGGAIVQHCAVGRIAPGSVRHWCCSRWGRRSYGAGRLSADRNHAGHFPRADVGSAVYQAECGGAGAIRLRAQRARGVPDNGVGLHPSAIRFHRPLVGSGIWPGAAQREALQAFYLE